MSHANTIFKIQPGGTLQGRIRVPGDKSISHRAIMLGSIAEGITQVTGFLEGEDCLATLRAFQQMGVQIEGPEEGRVIIHGVGLHGLQPPKQMLDLGNSGTAVRLLAGVLAGQTFDSELTGDASLRKRPMARVAEPLAQMGARLMLQSGNLLPMKIIGGQTLQGIHYKMKIASAQVKSCILLAGLYAEGETSVTEPALSRDHTERMLQTFGYKIQHKNSTVSLRKNGKLSGVKIYIPADISSAAFFMVGASIAPNSEVLLKHVGINPSRIGVINILRLMGASIEMENERMVGAEPVADIRVKSAKLHGIDIPLDQVPLAIDEFPAIFIAAACAKGITTLRNAAELRVKESDRIQVMAEGLQTLGIHAETQADGIRIEGGRVKGGRINSHGDHRIAMAFAMAGLVAEKQIMIDDCANVATSFPGFVELVEAAGLQISVG